jgi:hypothetical protein
MANHACVEARYTAETETANRAGPVDDEVCL